MPATAADAQSKQWYLDSMKAEAIWKSATGDGVKVAVIDSGVNPTVPSLKGQVLEGFDATEVKGEATDDFDGHGTTMAELIAGSGAGGGLKGLAPEAKIIPYRTSDKDFQGGERVNAFDDADAIRAAADSEAQIISMSFGKDTLDLRERDAVKYALGKGKLLFASVGNNAKEGNKRHYPAAYPGVVGVGAVDRNGSVADYSQHGDVVDLAAPGNDIPKWCDNTFKSYCDGDGGTSAATALASASAALIWSQHPDWTANQVLRVMIESAARAKGTEKGSVSTYLGHGVIRPNAAINRGIGKPGDPDVNPLTNEKTLNTKASPTPSASAAPKDQQAKADDKAEVAGAGESSESGGSTGLLIGGAAVVVVAAAAGFAVVRRKRAA
ncbi:type VII secretion-associated serine protease mycosin [Streptomyces indicus]|uniref:Type VII secretion-associated serine protease mycosin n=1 Tax=Streptomyces indicus TaxID=417292 RepID=A0A1G8VT47_9ACTN|nr:type VII secretion-associated serine protease mycosin [Streptomyces indicus]